MWITYSVLIIAVYLYLYTYTHTYDSQLYILDFEKEEVLNFVQCLAMDRYFLKSIICQHKLKYRNDAQSSLCKSELRAIRF